MIEPNHLLGLVALALGLAGFGGMWLSERFEQPTLGILSRWARWLLFACTLSFFAREAGWVWAGRPLWSLLAISFLLWFLVETGYVWVAIRKRNFTDAPLFPKYVPIDGGGEWPTQPHLIRLHEWLREAGYEPVQAMRASLTEDMVLRAFHFEKMERKIRLQVTFVPHGQTVLQTIYTLTSLTESGQRYVTDNAFLPRAGYLPANWRLRRSPLVASVERLERCHCERTEKACETFVPWEDLPLDDANEQQRLLEKANVEQGILMPRGQREEYGALTQEGRYRMWLELWLLKYFGIVWS